MRSLLAFILAAGLIFSAANVTTEGGNVTQLDLWGTNPSDYWDGAYGEVVLGPSLIIYTVGVTGGNVSELNLVGQAPQCDGYKIFRTYVVAANTSSIAYPLVNGDLSILDSLMPGSESGNRTFLSTGSSVFLPGGPYFGAPELETYAQGSPSSEFKEWYFNDANGNLVFAAIVLSNRPNWNGSTSDYQIMLPNGGSPLMQYWIQVYVNYTCGEDDDKIHELRVVPPGSFTVTAGEIFTPTFTVENNGDYREEDIDVYITNCPAGFACGSGWIYDINFAEDEDVSFPFTAGDPGEYVLTICAENYYDLNCTDFIVYVLPECEEDDDCGEGEECSEGKCEEEEPEECELSTDCAGNEVCAGGICIEIECECGHIQGHACIEYECCSDGDCAYNEVCIEHACVLQELEIILIDGVKIEGEPGLFQILNNRGEVVPFADVFTVDEATIADEHGYATLLFPYDGIIYADAEGYDQVARLYDLLKLGIIEIETEVAYVGVPAPILVTDRKGNPLAEAEVFIDGLVLITDGDGKVWHTFTEPGLKKVTAKKPGYIIRDGEIPVVPAEMAACLFPFCLNLVSFPPSTLYILLIFSFVLAAANFIISKRRMTRDYINELKEDGVHLEKDYGEVVIRKRREHYLKAFIYAFLPLVLALPNYWIFSICIMANVILLQFLREMWILFKGIVKKMRRTRRKGVIREQSEKELKWKK